MLSDNIRKYRKDSNMSQDELAEKLDVSRQSISLWENGQTQPTIDNIIALSNIFHISTDELLGEEREAATTEKSAPKQKGKRKWWLIIGIPVAVLAAVIAVYYLFGTSVEKNHDTPASASGITSDVSDVTSADDGDAQAQKTTAKAAKKKTTTTTAKPKKTTAKATTAKTTAAATKAAEKFDLFAYCRDFAIQKGDLNGDYTMYQQPSTLYGGYDNEYFSISYWADSNMVEFCLHCPLDDTYSINFYLRMRGGYNGKYEYLSSRYYRSDGESIRSATGYIDPAVFTNSYPISCDEYIGTTDKQNDFMEETRIGMCDLIKCLKEFAKVENMECGFEAFGFTHF